MSFKITPNEFHVLDGRYMIKTRLPLKEVTDERVADRCGAANLDVGDMVLVLVTNHGYDTVLASRSYLVTRRTSEFHRTQVDDRVNQQGERFVHRVHPLDDWRKFSHPEIEEAEKAAAAKKATAA